MNERFGFLLFNGLEELDLVGPWEMITMWGHHFGGPQEIVTVSQDGNPVKCAKGLQIAANYSLLSCPSLNYLLIPGGKATRHEVNNKNLVEFTVEIRTSTHTVIFDFLLNNAGSCYRLKSKSFISRPD
jgi:putative intracellular protease/amidase